MKCPKCGFTNNRSVTRCVKCGAGFPGEQRTSTEQETAQQARPSVPEWRKEVTRKAREYGERKKVLTTPPRPLKEQGSDSEPATPEAPALHKREIPASVESEPARTTPEVFPSQTKSSSEPLIQQSQPHRRLEFDLQEIAPPDAELDSDTSEEPSLYLGRRLASLLVDHAILGGLAYALAFFCREVLSYDLKTIYESAPLPIIGAILLFHFLYYFYFHKTARQTPGQVFFSLEVRDPLSGGIASGKVFTRWAALVFLNVLNLLPLLFGKSFLLLDRLSGTEVRSFKEK